MVEELRARHWGKWVGGILSVLVLGALGNALWELVFKPGLSSASRMFLTVVTLGSDAVRDRAYWSAAMDPRPVSSLMLLVALISFLFTLAVVVIVAKANFRLGGSTSKGSAARARRLSRLRVFVIAERYFLQEAALVLSILMTIGSCVIVSQSVLIWRVFHADLVICAPHLNSQEEEELAASFASMKTRADYLMIRGRLLSVAETNGVKLTDIETW